MAAGADAAARSEMTPGGRRVPTVPSRRHLPDLGSVETITMAPTLAQISGWRWWVTLSGRAVRGAIGQAHPPAPKLAARS
jgi:hypothetical protein